MTKDEWTDLVGFINGLWPGRPFPEDAAVAWWRRLRNRDAEDVRTALEELSGVEERRPSLARLEASIRSVRSRRGSAPGAVKAPRPTRCEHRVEVPNRPEPVVCRGMVTWSDAGDGWLLGQCDECGRGYAPSPASEVGT